MNPEHLRGEVLEPKLEILQATFGLHPCREGGPTLSRNGGIEGKKRERQISNS